MAESKHLLLDTDVIIDHLRGYAKSSQLFDKIKSGHLSPYLSTVTIVELYSFGKMEIPYEVEKVDQLLKYMSIVSLDAQIAKTAGEFRRKYLCGFPDAVIASTAYQYKLSLATRNLKHFEIIKEISLVKPY